jgi:hypothetical protein
VPLTPESIKDALKAELRYFTKDPNDKTYDQLADELEVSKGVLWKFVNKDYLPDDLVIRRKLGIHEPEYIPQYRNPLGRFTNR